MADIIGYTALAAEAKTLIEGTGRSVVFNRFDQAPADAGKPWEGPANPIGTPDATATLHGTFVPPADSRALGLGAIDADLLKRSEQICIAAPGTVSPPFDLRTANQLVDGGTQWKVVFTQTLKPGDVVLLYFIGVQR